MMPQMPDKDVLLQAVTQKYQLRQGKPKEIPKVKEQRRLKEALIRMMMEGAGA